MILTDYLSRHHVSDDHTTDLIPLSFCCFSLFLHHKGFDTYHITMISQAKAAREVAPKLHGNNKALYTQVKPEHQSKRQPLLLLLKGSMFNPWTRNLSLKASNN